jgi:hypothetical protein
MQLGAFLPRAELRRIVEIEPLADALTDRSMTDAVRYRAERQFARATERLRGMDFASLVIDTGTFHSAKSIPVS